MKVISFLIEYITLFFFLLQGGSQVSPTSPTYQQPTQNFPTFETAIWVLLLGMIGTVVWFLKTNARKNDERFIAMDDRITESNEANSNRIAELSKTLADFEKTVIEQNGTTKLHHQEKIHEMQDKILEAINNLKFSSQEAISKIQSQSNDTFATKKELNEVKESIKM